MSERFTEPVNSDDLLRPQGDPLAIPLGTILRKSVIGDNQLGQFIKYGGPGPVTNGNNRCIIIQAKSRGRELPEDEAGWKYITDDDDKMVHVNWYNFFRIPRAAGGRKRKRKTSKRKTNKRKSKKHSMRTNQI